MLRSAVAVRGATRKALADTGRRCRRLCWRGVGWQALRLCSLVLLFACSVSACVAEEPGESSWCAHNSTDAHSEEALSTVRHARRAADRNTGSADAGRDVCASGCVRPAPRLRTVR